MKRDITIAIIVGFIIGIIVALILTNLPKIVKDGIKISSSLPTASPTITQIENTASPFELTLDSPKDESISISKNIELSGHTKPHNIVIMESEIDQITVESNDTGAFSAKLDLREGVNSIFLTSYDETGNSDTKNINIFYTSEKL